MSINNLRFNILSPPPSPEIAARKAVQLQADLVSMARLLAIDEVSAAMAHQLNEPLTALRLYLYDIKQKSERGAETVPLLNSIRDMADKALRETERVCEITEKMDHLVPPPIATEVDPVKRGRLAIDALTRSGIAKISERSESTAAPLDQVLTPRECEVLALIVDGASNKVGGQSLRISTRTFEVHRAHIMEKLGARNAADLVRLALSAADHK